MAPSNGAGNDWRRVLADAVHETIECGRLVEVHGLDGLSGDCVIGLLQRLARIQESRGEGDYLEIGVFRGLTLCSVAAVLEQGHANGIDNFSQFDPSGTNREAVLGRIHANQLGRARLIDMDFEQALQELEQHFPASRIGLLFVDGPHDYRSQLMSLLLAIPYLSPRALIVVDDANYAHVRQATIDFLNTHPEFKLLMEAYTPCHPKNMRPEERASAAAGWWNGINVIVRDPDGLLTHELPPSGDLELFRMDHEVHGSAAAALTPKAAAFASSLRPLQPLRALRRLGRLAREARRLPAMSWGEFRTMNTFSRSLPPLRCNRSLEGERVERIEKAPNGRDPSGVT